METGGPPGGGCNALSRHRVRDRLAGRTVVDRDGRKVGRLEEIYLDRETDRPAWAALHTGLFGLRRTFVPLAGARAAGDDVQVPWPEDLIKHAPGADPDVTLSEEEEDQLYRHYGMAGPESTAVGGSEGGAASEGRAGPSAAVPAPQAASSDHAERTDPESGTGATTAAADSEAGDDADEMPSVIRSEEEVRVGKRRVGTRLRLKKYVVTDEEVVPVRREEVRIERVAEGEGQPEVLFDSADDRNRPSGPATSTP